MTVDFLSHIKTIEDHRIVGMVTYPLDEVLLTTLVGLLCRADDFDEIELLGQEQLGWLRQFLPFKDGIPQAQTFRKIFRLLDAEALDKAFASWIAGLQKHVSGVVAIDGKTLRGSKHDAGGKDALHLVSAYAYEAGLVIGQRAVDTKSNEITVIPELLDALVLTGAIVTIDAMGTQKDIAAKIRERKADYLLALKGNQGTLHDDVEDFFDDPDLSASCPAHSVTNLGHAPMESFFGSLKNECVHQTRFKTRKEAKAALFEYIEMFYNRRRLHSGIGYRTPAQAYAEMTRMAA